MNLRHKLPCVFLFVIVTAVNLGAADVPALQTARQLVEDGRYGEALIALSEVSESEVGNDVKAEAAAEAGEVLTLLGQLEEAANQFEVAKTFLEMSDTPEQFRSEMASTYLYRLANSCALARRWERSKAVFEDFIEEGRQDFGQPAERFRSAQRKVEWIDQRILSRSKITFHFVCTVK